MKLLLFLPLLFVGCTSFYEDGKKVASIGSDVEWVDITTNHNLHFATGKIGNAVIHGAIGGMISKGILSTGTSIATSGLTQYLK